VEGYEAVSVTAAPTPGNGKLEHERVNIIMKKLNLLSIVCVIASCAAALQTGCAGDRYRESTGEYIDDTALTAHVKSALGSDAYKYPDVKVTTFKGAVQLSGFVNDNAQKDRAETVAKGVQGVREVINNISVKG
jgi:hypothetical protein